ncbi:hypothetical protein FRB96_005154 [Tulasnella sp. 330]|nr:hypothetical protein FRB96_005154 [Tulasnella sp. 330]KAG8874397.1 hypothetical protein FRB97_005945 [Tulasnella sp. 331]
MHPSPSTSSASLDELAEIDGTLRQLDIEMRRMERKMASLQERSRRLKERRRVLTPSAPWIFRLPSELLSQCLLRGTQAIGNSPASTSPTAIRRDRVKLPIAVSQVCKQWRAAALNLPTLWNYVDMREGRPYDRTLVWLKRSRNAVLDIDLDYRDQLTKPEAYFQRNFLITLNVILPTMGRWGSLCIHAPTELVQTALHVFTSPAPMLQSLILKGWTDENQQHQPVRDMPPTIFCSQTPKLRYVYAREVGLRWDTCVFPGLRELTLARIPHEHVPNVAQFSRMMDISASGLQRLTVVGAGPRPMPAVHNHAASPSRAPQQQAMYKITLPRLLELRLEDLEVGEIRTLVSLLATPALRKLALAKIDDDDDMDGSIASDAEWRPQQLPYLSDLTYIDVPTSSGLFQIICQAAPNISRLQIRGEATNSILQYLTPEPLLLMPGEEEMFLPRLSALEMDEASAETVRAFIDARTTTLREVKGSILNERRIKSKGVLSGDDAVRHLGWQRNSNIHVAIQPNQPLAQ